jgi:2-oxo-4-hydroxy-4-carboxy-5-ureidoimidazoline decarboxylase
MEERAPTVVELSGLERDAFVAALDGIYEHSPWIAAQAWPERPFVSLDELHAALREVMERSERRRRLELIQAHPDLATPKLATGELTTASTGEQRSAGLDQLADDRRDRLREANAAYRERFGHSCIVCVREHPDVDSIISAIERRTAGAHDEELDACIAEVTKIARLRLLDRVATGWVSTHVLDTVRGAAGSGMTIHLAIEHEGRWQPLRTLVTNADGRTDEPLLDRGEMRAGRIQIRFVVDAYFRAHGVPTADPPYLGEVPIEVTLADGAAHYHVPLIVAPWGYSTYRGS